MNNFNLNSNCGDVVTDTTKTANGTKVPSVIIENEGEHNETMKFVTEGENHVNMLDSAHSSVNNQYQGMHRVRVNETVKTSTSNHDVSLLEPNGYNINELDSLPDLSSMPQIEEIHCHFGKKMTKDKVARNQLITVVVLCLTFMTGEAIGGVYANSLALFTDVLHLGSDLISFLISLLAIYLSQKPPTRKMSFGYHRAEVLGALISVQIIWLVSAVLCYIAVERIVNEHYKKVKADEMLITAGLGVVFNLIMAGVLHSDVCCSVSSHSQFGHNHSHDSGSSHDHSHGNNHSHSQRGYSNTKRKNSDYQHVPLIPDGDSSVEIEMSEAKTRSKNINVRAAFIHVIGDIIQSIGVFVAALIIKFTDDERYRLADPICTFIFSLIVLITTVAVLRDTLSVMLEGTPKDVGYDYVKDKLESLNGIVVVHSLHIWSLTLGRNALTVHLAKNDKVTYHNVLQNAKKLLKKEFDFFHVTIQVENYIQEVMSQCVECNEIR